VERARAGQPAYRELAGRPLIHVAGDDNVVIQNRDGLGIIISAEINGLLAVAAEAGVQNATGGEARDRKIACAAADNSTDDDSTAGIDRHICRFLTSARA